MPAQAVRANVINVFDMGLIGFMLGLSYACAAERIIAFI